jgi:hypothetical protein
VGIAGSFEPAGWEVAVSSGQSSISGCVMVGSGVLFSKLSDFQLYQNYRTKRHMGFRNLDVYVSYRLLASQHGTMKTQNN